MGLTLELPSDLEGVIILLVPQNHSVGKEKKQKLFF